MALTYTQGAGGVIFQTNTGSVGDVISTNSAGGAGDLQLLMFAITDNATVGVGSTGYAIAASQTTGDVTAYVMWRSPGGSGVVNLPVTASTRWYAVGNELTITGLSRGAVIACNVSAYSTATALTASAVATSGEAMIFAAGGWFAVNDPNPVPTIGTPSPGTWTTRASITGWMDQVQAAALGSGRGLVWDASVPWPTGSVTATASTAAKGYAALLTVGAAGGWSVGSIRIG